VFASRPAYALRPIGFRFPALAALAGRAPMGGQREVALAMYVVARLAQDAVGDEALAQPLRAERAAAARSWLASLTPLPTTVRIPLSKAVDASGQEPAAIAAAVRAVIDVTAGYLDSGARSEVAQLAAALDSQALVR
jgi:hypothetical protein